MKEPLRAVLSLALAGELGFACAASAQAGIQITPLTGAQPWQRMEFRITGVPAVANPFDPDLIRVDSEFVLPSGQPRPTCVSYL